MGSARRRWSSLEDNAVASLVILYDAVTGPEKFDLISAGLRSQLGSIRTPSAIKWRLASAEGGASCSLNRFGVP